jgi:hypothetical protein
VPGRKSRDVPPVDDPTSVGERLQKQRADIDKDDIEKEEQNEDPQPGTRAVVRLRGPRGTA